MDKPQVSVASVVPCKTEEDAPTLPFSDVTDAEVYSNDIDFMKNKLEKAEKKIAGHQLHAENERVHFETTIAKLEEELKNVKAIECDLTNECQTIKQEQKEIEEQSRKVRELNSDMTVENHRMTTELETKNDKIANLEKCLMEMPQQNGQVLQTTNEDKLVPDHMYQEEQDSGEYILRDLAYLKEEIKEARHNKSLLYQQKRKQHEILWRGYAELMC